MRKKIFTLVATLFMASSVVSAEDFFDTSVPDKVFTIGVRAGVNMSNISNNLETAIPSQIKWAKTSWKTGFSGGIVADLKIRNFIAIQPGFFLQLRHNECYILDADRIKNMEAYTTSTYLQIPLLVSLRHNLSEIVQWQVDLGPYFSFGVGGNVKTDIYEAGKTDLYNKEDLFGDDGMIESFDWGFKMGTGLLIDDHYYIGAHYEAGCRNPLRPMDGSIKHIIGHHKVWNFTLGYNF